MFACWILTAFTVVKAPRWVPVAAIVTLVVTALLLKAHITDPIDVEF